jgi:RHS repeat-associated protein
MCMTPSAACASDSSFEPSRSTGKERDAESGNDYFGARYYASSMGRWLSPDWSAKVTPVPYAKLDDPQSLNLYAYVMNNPLVRFDRDGHIDCSGKNAQGVGCQRINQWNAEHDVLSTGSRAAIAKSKLTDEEKVAFSDAVVKSAGKENVDPNLIVGLGYKESGINPNSVNSDARGIFQIRPARQTDLKLTDEQVFSVTGAIAAVAGYFGRTTNFFNFQMGLDVGESLAIASWTMGVQNTMNVVRKSSMEGIRNIDLRDKDHHRVGPDYIDEILSFEEDR